MTGLPPTRKVARPRRAAQVVDGTGLTAAQLEALVRSSSDCFVAHDPQLTPFVAQLCHRGLVALVAPCVVWRPPSGGFHRNALPDPAQLLQVARVDGAGWEGLTALALVSGGNVPEPRRLVHAALVPPEVRALVPGVVFVHRPRWRGLDFDEVTAAEALVCAGGTFAPPAVLRRAREVLDPLVFADLLADVHGRRPPAPRRRP